MNDRGSASPIPALTAALVEANDQLLALYELTAMTQTSFDADVVIPEILEQAQRLAALGSVTFSLASGEHWSTGGSAALVEYSIAVANESISGVLELSRDQPFSTGDRKLMTAVAEVALGAAQTSRMHDEAVASAVVERDHDTASELAQLSLPSWRPEVDGLSFFARSDPARKAGGDFFCFSETDDRLLFAVGDVSGKGLPAAMMMTTAISAATAAFGADEANDPAVSLQNIDRWMRQPLEEASLFITLLVGSYQASTRTLALANAGHSPVMVNQQHRWQRLDAHVPPVGVLALSGPNALPIEVHEITFEVGDRFVVASDGFTEQADPSGQFFGDERLTASLDDLASADLGETEVGDAMFDRLGSFAADCEPGDDRTLLLLEAIPSTLASFEAA